MRLSRVPIDINLPFCTLRIKQDWFQHCQTLCNRLIEDLKHCGAQSKLCPQHHFTLCFDSKSHCEGLTVNTGEQTSLCTHSVLKLLSWISSSLVLSLQPWATAAYFCCYPASFFCPALISWAPTVFPCRPSNCRPYPAMTKLWGSCRVWPSPTSTKTGPTDTNLPWTVLQMSTCTLRSVAPAAGSQHCRPPAVLVIPPRRVSVRCFTGEELVFALCFPAERSNSSAVKWRSGW